MENQPAESSPRARPQLRVSNRWRERAAVPRVVYYVSPIKQPVIRVHTVHASSISELLASLRGSRAPVWPAQFLSSLRSTVKLIRRRKITEVITTWRKERREEKKKRGTKQRKKRRKSERGGDVPRLNLDELERIASERKIVVEPSARIVSRLERRPSHERGGDVGASATRHILCPMTRRC